MRRLLGNENRYCRRASSCKGQRRQANRQSATDRREIRTSSRSTRTKKTRVGCDIEMKGSKNKSIQNRTGRAFQREESSRSRMSAKTHGARGKPQWPPTYALARSHRPTPPYTPLLHASDELLLPACLPVCPLRLPSRQGTSECSHTRRSSAERASGRAQQVLDPMGQRGARGVGQGAAAGGGSSKAAAGGQAAREAGCSAGAVRGGGARRRGAVHCVRARGRVMICGAQVR